MGLNNNNHAFVMTTLYLNTDEVQEKGRMHYASYEIPIHSRIVHLNYVAVASPKAS